jgi:hypothetical protein
VSRILSKGIPIYFVIEDAEDRGLAPAELVNGTRGVPRAGLARLLDSHDRVWHW